MIELVALLAGGFGRLVIHLMDLWDKQAERVHELAMFELQERVAAARYVVDAELRQGESFADNQALIAAMNDQAAEAAAAGGWIAKLSALVRPILTLYHCVVFYTVAKVCMLVAAFSAGQGMLGAVMSVYGSTDQAICTMLLGFWFADRTLARSGR